MDILVKQMKGFVQKITMSLCMIALLGCQNLNRIKEKRKMIKQCVVRTLSYFTGYENLQNLLSNGWIVIMCTPIDDQLEYILQKEVEEDE